jgi:hypothetical protein
LSLGSSETDGTFTTDSTLSSISDRKREYVSDPTVAELKRDLIDRLMHQFRLNYNIRGGLRSHAENNSNATGSNSQFSTGSSNFSRNPFGATKRGVGGRGNGSSEDDREDERHGKRSKMAMPPAVLDKSKFACPYYIRAPWKHQTYRSCAGPGWPTIHRLK